MAEEKTENISLSVYSDITGVYQRELRQSYYNNFIAIDAAFKTTEENLKEYVDTVLGEIENASY